MTKARERTFLHRLTGNTLIGFAGTAVQRLLTFATTLVLARGLGEEGFGVYAFVVAYMFLFAFLSDLGIERVVTREIARRPDLAGELVGSALAVKLGLSGLAALAAVGTAFLLGLPPEATLCIVVTSLGLPLTVELVFRGYFQSRFRAGWSFATTMPATLIFLAASVATVHWRLPLHLLFAVGLVTGPCVLGALLWLAHYRFGLRLRVRRARVREILGHSVAVGGFVFLFILAMRIDQVMLFQLRDAAEVGFYAVAVRLGEALVIIPEAVLITLFPLLVRSEQHSAERFHHTYRLGFKYLAALSVPIALLLTLLRREIVAVVFGPEYAPAELALAVLAWNTFFGYVGVVYVNLFLAQARQRLLLVVSAIAVSTNIILNLILIPPWGATGAATATLIASAVGFLCWLAAPATRPYMVACLFECWRPVLAAALAMVVVWTLGWQGWAAGAAVAAAYSLLVWLLGGVAWSDVRLVQRLFATDDEPALG